MKDIILSYIVVALGCVCIALAVTTWHIKRTARNDALAAFEKQYSALKEELHRFDHDNELLIHQVAKRDEEILHLKSQVADLLDALTEAQRKYKELQSQTVEMPEVPTAAPIAVKRVRGKKAASE